MLRSYVRLTIAFLLLTAAVQRPAAERVVAVGDVHGDLDRFAAILQKAGLIDEARRWTGGRATLVQLGDLIDRGPKSRAGLDFVMTLQQEASRHGGSVRISMGNHEMMILMGDMRYVAPQDYAAFTDDRSERRQRAAFRDYARLQASRGRPVNEVDEAEWMELHPVGFIEHRQAFDSQGKYGKWLRTLPAVNRVGDSIFLHGGINPVLGTPTVDGINAAIAGEVEAFDRIKSYMVDKGLALPFFTLEELVDAATAEVEESRLKAGPNSREDERRHIRLLSAMTQFGSWLSVHNGGPLWFRGYDWWSEQEGEAQINLVLQALKAQRIIVGHSVQPEVRQRFGGKVYLIDTGMLGRGNASALEISNGRIRAIYMDKVTEFN